MMKQRKTYSTQHTYDGYLRKWILPRWQTYKLSEVKAVEVEQWLKRLSFENGDPLAKGSKATMKHHDCALSGGNFLMLFGLHLTPVSLRMNNQLMSKLAFTGVATNGDALLFSLQGVEIMQSERNLKGDFQMVNAPVSSERLADHFVNYLFDQYSDNRHVRRVASWIGFVVKAAENVSNGSLRLEQKRQIMFDYKGYKFKVKYNHKTGFKGGLDIVEVLAGRGAPEGAVVMHVTNLADAEDCYLNLKSRLESLLEKRKPIPVVFKKIEIAAN